MILFIEKLRHIELIQIAGALLWLSFYGGYIWKALKQRKKGISVNRMGRGRKPAAAKAAEAFLILLTPAMALVQLLSIGFYGKWELLLGVDGGKRTGGLLMLAGLAVALFGVQLFILAMIHMKDSWRAGIDEGEDTALVTYGVYSFSRNPAFVGFDLFYIGFALLFSNALQLLFALLGVFAFHMQIRQEEIYMEKRYGEDYLRYKETTGRYFGSR